MAAHLAKLAGCSPYSRLALHWPAPQGCAGLDLCGDGGCSMAFVGVRQQRVLGSWEHARMAWSSSIRPARLTGSLRMIRFGVVAGWWRVRKGDLAKDALISVVVGVALLFGALVVGRQAPGTSRSA